MKHVFLLDENILMRAVAGDVQAIKLWKLIRENCHRIASDDAGELARKYWAHLRREKGRVERSYPAFPALLGAILQNSEKNDTRQAASHIAEETYVRHQKDHYLLRILANGGGYLVTTDAVLRRNFNRSEISTRFNIRALTIEKAAELAKDK